MCGIGELKLAIIATAVALVVLLLDFFGSRLWPKLVKPGQEDDEFIPRDRD
jgi:putative Mg2+ transporter-C (MgtC) family protein